MVLGPFGYFLTLFAVWAAIKRSTWLMALMACWAGCPASRCSNRYDFVVRRANQPRNLVLAMIAAILPYIMLNLGILGRRTKSLWVMRAVR